MRPRSPAGPRVLHVIHRLGDGGADRTLTRLVNARESRSRHILYSLAPVERPHERPRRGVPLASGPGTAAPLAAHVAAALRLARGVDVVHGWVSSATPVAALVAAALGVPLVLRQPTNIARELEVQPWAVGPALAPLRRAFQAADRVVLPSRALEACTTAVYGPLPTVVIPNAVPPVRHRWEGARQRPCRVRLVFAGRLVPQKHPLALVEACLRLPPDVEWSLDLFGDGPLAGEIGARAAAAGASTRIRLAGFRGNWLKAAVARDVFVLPTRFEGMCNTLLEVAAAGMPIVTTDIPENRVLFEDGVDARLVPVDDPATLAAALTELARNTALRRRLGAGAARLSARFPFSATLRGHDDLYASLS
ncbi:MAG: glycosyltransferase family 4 protein [Acidobacteriota bacterium]